MARALSGLGETLIDHEGFARFTAHLPPHDPVRSEAAAERIRVQLTGPERVGRVYWPPLPRTRRP